MADCEKLALLGLLRRLQPKLALEIGTYQGGSLQAIARYSEKVISVDIDPGVATRLAGKFSNVEFRSGDSRRVLPGLVQELNEQKKPVGLVLIDGDHSTEGVRRDIEALLELRPLEPILFLLHDSFNPACRKGMRVAQWANCPFVHEVELDFIPGIYHYHAYDTAEPRSMWGGLASALLLPEKRTGELVIQESQRELFDVIRQNSQYRFDGCGPVRRRLLRGLEKTAELFAKK
jgi:hypothetical protein